MLKHSAAAVLACSVLVTAGCSSDDDNTPDLGAATGTTSTFKISFTNGSVGQPMTLPVVALHNPSVSFFDIGEAASLELQSIAEDGSNDLMLALVERSPGVSDSGQAFVDAENQGPFNPGEIATITLETDVDTDVLTAVNMVICTNDGFTGVDSVALPTGTDTVRFEALPYDAGSEVNVINLEYWVPPCGGTGANLHDDENGVIGIHPGQMNEALEQFNFVGTDSILTVSVTRVDTTDGVE